MQDRDHTFTISMMPGEHPTANGPYAYLERATDLQDLLSMYAARMPRPLNLTFIMDDNPAVMLSYTERDRMVELASQGECELAQACIRLSTRLTHRTVCRLRSFGIRRTR